MVLSNTVKSFVGMLLGPVAFLRFNVFIKDCTSLRFVGVRKNVFSRGSSRKSGYFLSELSLSIFILPLSLFISELFLSILAFSNLCCAL